MKTELPDYWNFQPIPLPFEPSVIKDAYASKKIALFHKKMHFFGKK